ncbi:MAG: hypothetical protein O3B90_03175 [Actinomycetota bacterium]|jgi:hypothetical protein|uniref:hypothetical protein n=1 Tax=uncultured Ilumatobacter sp. TaxID=879968 RepID=UPI00374EB001|nr:hypothetical protein [Actinomycetota bacterium]
MGLFDKVKGMFGKAKDKTDDAVEANSDKIPDDVESKYDEVSEAAETIIPGEDAPSE